MVEQYITYIPLPSIRWRERERHMWRLCYSLRLTTMRLITYVCHMFLSRFSNHFVCMYYIRALYVPSYSEVKRVYDVYQYIFSGEESMCWIYIIYSQAQHRVFTGMWQIKLSEITRMQLRTGPHHFPAESVRVPGLYNIGLKFGQNSLSIMYVTSLP